MTPSELAHNVIEPDIDWKAMSRKWELRAKQNREAWQKERARSQNLARRIESILKEFEHEQIR
ncbi:MAG: hypothetical protein ABF780_08225 [Bifidobacterium aquikefiri]|uniref:Uncharacterized protein n=1 Tax=Bifidobacterium aquikefiri TaxID=1653207 RepID=A0A261G8D5_9BIFI|nr:hypothetical protein [Bifidobacterium aquikefiri]OZG67266.1 hypothetical protein BAQU_1339 [Bifidobacterium aquikefiri]